MRVFPSRNLVDLLEPDPALIELGDIARGLSRVCRFGGHVNGFISVAEHSLSVMGLVGEFGDLHPLNGIRLDLLRWALLHDATEAYLGDMVGPLKHHPSMGLYRSLEDRWEWAIIERFDLRMSPEIRALVKRADRLDYDREAAETRDRSFRSSPEIHVVEQAFLARAAQLGLS